MLKTISFLFFMTVLLFAGCGSDDEALVHFQLINPTFSVDNIEITADDGLLNHTIDEDDYIANGNSYRTHEFRTRKSGTLKISFEIYDGVSRQVDPVIEGELDLELKSDWFWSVDFIVSDMNPFEFCMGCSGYQAWGLPEILKRNENDSLYIIWGGNSIKNPVIY